MKIYLKPSFRQIKMFIQMKDTIIGKVRIKNDIRT